MTTVTTNRRGWFGNLFSVTKSLWAGLRVTMSYFVKPGTVITLQYPLQKDDLPDRHRGIHLRRATRRQPAGRHTHRRHRDRHAGERHRIIRCYAEKQPLDQPRREQGTDHAQHQPGA